MEQKILKQFNRIVDFLEKQPEKIELIVIGGLARYFYNLPRHTIDIDAEIKCSSSVYEKLYNFCQKANILINIGENISGWGIIPLPEGYRKRATTIKETSNLSIKVLSPIDYVFSKLARGTEQDIHDALDVCRHFKISQDAIQKHLSLVKLPLDPESRFFIERLEIFKEKLTSK
ncbi:MAG: hypothetical protein D6710_02665 [Nitrospirae bacterium]|nr:MAG: hypothetical protein D6710_02665 [Nitrospirota bacterium]